VEECGPYPVFASFTLAFALQLRKKTRINLREGKKKVRLKTSFRVEKPQSGKMWILIFSTTFV
jgi:hypothetical protein